VARLPPTPGATATAGAGVTIPAPRADDWRVDDTSASATVDPSAISRRGSGSGTRRGSGSGTQSGSGMRRFRRQARALATAREAEKRANAQRIAAAAIMRAKQNAGGTGGMGEMDRIMSVSNMLQEPPCANPDDYDCETSNLQPLNGT
jgi:hypothetical protein